MEWMCAECGRPHPKNNPPCKNCGSMQFEKTVVREEAEDGSVDPASIEWKCPECGRTSPRNNPPCSRCGNMHLEAIELGAAFDDAETSAGLGAFDVMKFVGSLAVIGILIFVFANTGVLTSSPPPTVENVPGDANYSNGLNLDRVGDETAADINAERASEGLDTLLVESETSNIAEYYNQLMVKRTEYPLDQSSDGVREEFQSCSTPTTAYNQFSYESSNRRAINAYSSEEELTREISKSWLSNSGTRPILLDEGSSIGVDIHVAENGDIYITAVVC